jgi:hypothetical protein
LNKKLLPAAVTVGVVLAATAVGLLAHSDGDGGRHEHFEFKDDTLVLSRSVFAGTASTVTIGQTLPPGCVAGTVAVPLIAGGTTNVKVKCATAIDNGEYPNLTDTHNVWNNDTADGSFGLTSPIFLDNITTRGELLDTLPIPTDLLVTSFSSKSELAVNRSTDGKSITFVGYHGGPGFVTGPNQLDVSNSSTPGVVDPTNPVVSNYYRAVVEVDADGHITRTDGNGYSGNNGRAAIKADWLYYMAGNDNNGGLSTSQLTSTQVGVNLITSTDVELLVPTQYPTALNPATGGCRNITGRHNHDGTVTLFAITSTISANGDQGADPNKLVKVTDVLAATKLPTGDGDNDRDDRIGHFVTIRSALAGEVFRGVAFAPTGHRDDGQQDE